jgi:6-bladed beta-propeller
MVVHIGDGEFKYAMHMSWGRLPTDWTFGDVAAVATDSRDRLYVFNRSPHPMIILDKDGEFLDSWGEATFTHAHGVEITPDDYIYCTDDGDHTVRKCTLYGEVLLELGSRGIPAPFMSGLPFRRCTQTAVAPAGDIYVSDGYGNNRVHCFSADGELLMSFGASGTGPGEFNFPHSIACDAVRGRLYIADRENHRVQSFGLNGEFLGEWRNLHRPTSLCQLVGREPAWLIGEMGPDYSFNRGAPNLGPRLSIVDGAGKLITRLGVSPAAGTEPGQFLAPHSVCTDSRGDIYVAQPAVAAWHALFPQEKKPDDLPSLLKLVKL